MEGKGGEVPGGSGKKKGGKLGGKLVDDVSALENLTLLLVISPLSLISVLCRVICGVISLSGNTGSFLFSVVAAGGSPYFFLFDFVLLEGYCGASRPRVICCGVSETESAFFLVPARMRNFVLCLTDCLVWGE